MLRTTARDRPSATKLLASNELKAKLHLDEMRAAQPMSQHQAHQKLMETIKVPQNMRRLNKGLLPKPCYPDARPNSPTSWTVAEQAYAQKKAAKAAAAAEAAEAAAAATDAPLHLHPQMFPLRGCSCPASRRCCPPQGERCSRAQGQGPPQPPSRHYVRRPLAAADNQQPQAPSAREDRPVRKVGDYRHESRYAQYNRPRLECSEERSNLEPINRPRIPYSHGQYGTSPEWRATPLGCSTNTACGKLKT